MPSKSDYPLSLRIICLNPALNENTLFGLQDKAQQLTEGTLRPDGALIFECDVQITKRGDQPDFAGAFVQGTPGKRFLYLSLRDLSAGHWIKRIKIPLSGITDAMIAAAQKGVLQVTIDGQGVATVELLDGGWRAV